MTHLKWSVLALGLTIAGCDLLLPGKGGENQPCSGAGNLCEEDLTCNEGKCISLKTIAGDLIWISIPGGSYQMGSTSSSSEQPMHTVNVPTFKMTKTEVTVSQYLACTQASGCSNPSTSCGYSNWGVSGRDSHPVNCVNWSQAVAFCTWAGARLPSETEWEYAARGGGQTITFPWGEQTPSCTYAVMNEGGLGCGTGGTIAVCSKTPGNTTQGLCDMVGNVWEWVQDWYHNSYTGAPTDGSSWETPAGSFRVFRGGSWRHDYTIDLRASNRSYDNPVGGSGDRGFRCARRL